MYNPSMGLPSGCSEMIFDIVKFLESILRTFVPFRLRYFTLQGTSSLLIHWLGQKSSIILSKCACKNWDDSKCCSKRKEWSILRDSIISNSFAICRGREWVWRLVSWGYTCKRPASREIFEASTNPISWRPVSQEQHLQASHVHFVASSNSID